MTNMMDSAQGLFLYCQEVTMGSKAKGSDFIGRFREIISDPLNLLIRKDPRAGFMEGINVYLHNGLRVPESGPDAYYGGFSSILRINRGIHEPLEEFVFQEVIKRLHGSPTMLELGAYWGHYSMWLKLVCSRSSVHLVEPDPGYLDAGKHNFELNGFAGEFTHAFVGKNKFGVDEYLAEKNIQKLDILHCDIQGNEMEMLEDCAQSLISKTVDYLFISTHSQQLHIDVMERLNKLDYRVEVSSDFDSGTTSFDGLVFASSPSVDRVFDDFIPMTRVQIEQAQPAEVVDYLSNIMRMTQAADVARDEGH